MSDLPKCCEGRDVIVRSVGATVLAGLLLRIPLVRAIPKLVIGLALAAIRPALLVLGIVKAVECIPRFAAGTHDHQTHNP